MSLRGFRKQATTPLLGRRPAPDSTLSAGDGQTRSISSDDLLLVGYPDFATYRHRYDHSPIFSGHDLLIIVLKYPKL